MKLSVIICTYNRDQYIYNVLKSIATGTLPKGKYEVVLVDNNCTDNTKAECERFMQDYPDVEMQYVIEENQGLSYARNRGIAEAKGDILVYVDDDALVNEGYLEAYADFFEQNAEAQAAGGPIIPKYEVGSEPKWMGYHVKCLLTGYLHKGEQIVEFAGGAYPGGGNAAYRKEVFDEVGLFNVDLGRKGSGLMGSEEKDIFDKMRTKGMRFYYVPDAILYHLIPEKKLGKEYFERLTYSIGVSERTRTLQVGTMSYVKRLIAEGIKWVATLVLGLGYTLMMQAPKAGKLVAFRWNVTRGLIHSGK